MIFGIEFIYKYEAKQNKLTANKKTFQQAMPA